MLEFDLDRLGIGRGDPEVVTAAVAELDVLRVLYVVKHDRGVTGDTGIEYALHGEYEVVRLDLGIVAPSGIAQGYAEHIRVFLGFFRVFALYIFVAFSQRFFDFAVSVHSEKPFVKQTEKLHGFTVCIELGQENAVAAGVTVVFDGGFVRIDVKRVKIAYLVEKIHIDYRALFIRIESA